MAGIINQIPGYENGRVKRMSASELSAPIIAAEIASTATHPTSFLFI